VGAKHIPDRLSLKWPAVMSRKRGIEEEGKRDMPDETVTLLR